MWSRLTDKTNMVTCHVFTPQAKGISIQLKGSSVVIDRVRYGHGDIHNFPKGLSTKQVKIVASRNGTAF